MTRSSDAAAQAQAEYDQALAAYRRARNEALEHQRKYVQLAPSPQGAWHLAQWLKRRPKVRALFEAVVLAQGRVTSVTRELSA